MSKVDVFDITVSQLEEFAKVAYEDLSVYDLLDSYIVVTTWSWFGRQPRSMMVAYSPVADKVLATRYAERLDYNDLCANRMGITRGGNHYEVWHIVEDPIPTVGMDDFEGEGVTYPVYQRYELESYLGESVDEIEPEPVDWFGEMGDTLGEDYSEYIDAYEYVRAIDQMF